MVFYMVARYAMWLLCGFYCILSGSYCVPRGCLVFYVVVMWFLLCSKCYVWYSMWFLGVIKGCYVVLLCSK